MTDVITAGGLALLVLELLKYLLRVLWFGANFDFSKLFYTISLPIIAFLVQPFLAWLGISGFIMPVEWLGWLKELINVVIVSLMALLQYNAGLKPLKSYVRSIG